MKWAIYSPSGQIVRVITCDEGSILANCEGAEAFVEVHADTSDDTHYIEDGAAVQMPTRPSEAHVFDYATKVWIDPRTLDDLRVTAWSRVKLSRTLALDAQLATPYGTFDCSPDARQNITDAVLMMQTLSAQGTPSTIDFTLADNSTATLTAAQMTEVGLLMGQRTQSIYARARTLRSQISAAQTADEVNAITWESV